MVGPVISLKKTRPSNLQGHSFERMLTINIDDKVWITNIPKIENKIPSGSITDSENNLLSEFPKITESY